MVYIVNLFDCLYVACRLETIWLTFVYIYIQYLPSSKNVYGYTLCCKCNNFSRYGFKLDSRGTKMKIFE